jgi:hypothetical protein
MVVLAAGVVTKSGKGALGGADTLSVCNCLEVQQRRRECVVRVILQLRGLAWWTSL